MASFAAGLFRLRVRRCSDEDASVAENVASASNGLVIAWPDGIDAGQEFDLAFGLLEQALALAKEFDPFFVDHERIIQAKFVVLEPSRDLLETCERLFEIQRFESVRHNSVGANSLDERDSRQYSKFIPYKKCVIHRESTRPLADLAISRPSFELAQSRQATAVE